MSMLGLGDYGSDDEEEEERQEDQAHERPGWLSAICLRGKHPLIPVEAACSPHFACSRG